MPTIPEMDEFINWDEADPAVGFGNGVEFLTPMEAANELDHDLGLVLENVEGDDFSFWALQHYETSNLNTLDPTVDLAAKSAVPAPLEQAPSFESSFEIPEAPCAHCQQGGYQCKRINEGSYKGYCTSCVALRCGCSFGLAAPEIRPGSDSFPVNPWPTLGDHPDAIPQEGIHPELLHSTSTPDLASMGGATVGEPIPQDAVPVPKIGTRLSRDSVRILKNWLSTHSRHPYPSEDEKMMLQKQTGLNKTQITNWLANARRRGKIMAPRSTSPGLRNWSSPIDIPQRHGTPAPLENMNPLQRWQHSPPENEPASVAAIARAVTASASTLSSGLNSPYSANFTDDGSGRSLCAASSASSVNTSQSSGKSFASAYSHASRGSLGSFGSLNRGRRRRRRKVSSKRPDEKTSLATPLKTFQCTFCTETFRTKHDWQRHEKSLHLSLERWVCAPEGPRALNPENNQICCVFCGQAHPDDAHIENHNHSACQERVSEERTFYRKDHLRQHLKLVHGVKFVNWSMENWKLATPEIRSRCGFCGIVMDSWTARMDHLAEHFKTGNTMAEWKGDWGFEAPVLEMVENSIPPCKSFRIPSRGGPLTLIFLTFRTDLIHDERNSPLPYVASQMPHETPRNAYELLKSELTWFILNTKDTSGRTLTDEELQVEACRIVFGAEVLSSKRMSSTPSWLRDLLVSSEEVASRARLAPIRSQSDSRMAQLRINGKDNIFEEDSMERQLLEYVKARQMLGLTAMDSELQVEACNILGRSEESSSSPSDEVANFLLRLCLSSTKWLAAFRQRAHLPRSDDMADEKLRSKDPNTVDSTIHNYSRLEAELAEYVRTKRAEGVDPDDADLQREARIIIYEFDDDWNQTAADNPQWLAAFKQRHLQSPGTVAETDNSPLTIESVTRSRDFIRRASSTVTTPATAQGTSKSSRSGARAALKVSPFFIHDANCYQRLARELARFVASTTSPNNPNSHVPTDEELQHQARWILYDE